MGRGLYVALLSCAAGSLALGACSTLTLDDTPLVEQLPGDPGTGTEEGPAGTGLNTNLPCDVQAILENRCIACHDGKTAVAMLKYSDLVAPAPSDPSKTLAQQALLRMQSDTNPMPPPPAVPPEEDEIESFRAWVEAGLPRETMSCTDPPPDAGTDPDPVDASTDGGDAGSVCTSGTYWTLGNAGSPLMHPGMACNACHQQAGGPNLRIAGTVFPTLRDPDDCNGKGPPPQLTVIVTDRDNRNFNLQVNAAGNFVYENRLFQRPPRPPLRARVTDGTNTRQMMGTVTSGDCNSCHTAQGRNGAPGRILAP